MLTVICTSKPVDGLLYYSYEYALALQTRGVDVRLLIVCHPSYSAEHYAHALAAKYIDSPALAVQYNTADIRSVDTTLILGRSMMTLAYQNFNEYGQYVQRTVLRAFSCRLISVYSENHPVDYVKAMKFFSPTSVADLCDYEIYPSGVGDHFEKRVHFPSHRQYAPRANASPVMLLMGTNAAYYKAATAYLEVREALWDKHVILTYENAPWNDPGLNNLFAPIPDLMACFTSYAYTKSTFDPAPRLIQECKYHNKGLIWARPDLEDGGLVYWRRSLKPVDLTPILGAL